MNNVWFDVIGLGIFVFFIIRQVTPRRPSRLRFYFLPLIALYWAYHTLPHPVPRVEVWTTVISVGLSIPFAIMQAYFTRLYEQDSHWVMQGDWRYLMTWFVILALQGAIALAFKEPTLTWEISLGIAVVWGIRSVVLHLRYPQLSGILARKSGMG